LREPEGQAGWELPLLREEVLVPYEEEEEQADVL